MNTNFIDEILNSVHFSQPKVVDTRNGKMSVTSGKIPNGFWDVWKQHKENIKKMGFSVSQYRGEWQISKWIPIEEVEVLPIEPKEISLKYEDKLLSYQIPQVKSMIQSVQKWGSALDASDTGTGKTFTALAVCKELGLYPVVVCPKPVIPSWKSAMKHFEMDGFVSNYEQYKNSKTEVFAREGLEWNMSENYILIMDEVHRCKNYKTINSEMLYSAREQKVKILCFYLC